MYILTKLLPNMVIKKIEVILPQQAKLQRKKKERLKKEKMKQLKSKAAKGVKKSQAASSSSSSSSSKESNDNFMAEMALLFPGNDEVSVVVEKSAPQENILEKVGSGGCGKQACETSIVVLVFKSCRDHAPCCMSRLSHVRCMCLCTNALQ